LTSFLFIVFVGYSGEIVPNLSYAEPNRLALRLERMCGHPSSFVSLLMVSVAAAHIVLRSKGQISMPRGHRGEKCPAGVIGNAVHVMRIAAGEIEDTPSKAVALYMVWYNFGSSTKR
jgi:hypothetical protein